MVSRFFVTAIKCICKHFWPFLQTEIMIQIFLPFGILQPVTSVPFSPVSGNSQFFTHEADF